MQKSPLPIPISDPVDFEQTDYEKIRRIPFLFSSNIFTGAATLAAVGAPLTLFATELGLEADRIGLLGGIMPFFQILGVACLPLIMHFGCKRVAATALFSRYLFLLLFLLAPLFQNEPNRVFWLLFGAMALFSLGRTIAEAAYVPWSQEFMPKSIRGRLIGQMALAYLPVALLVSYAIKLWLDSHTGLDRFYPIFSIAVVLGLLGALSLNGLGGGRPRAQSARGLESIRSLAIPLRDRNFTLFLYSSGTQYLVFLIISVFLVLFLKVRLSIPSGQLVFMSSFVLFGGAFGSLTTGWLVDRLGTRGIRISLQIAQVFLLLTVPFIHGALPGVDFIVGGTFALFGFLITGSITAGNVYMLNYVPPDMKESYMALAYSVDGIIGGTATFAAGFLVYWLDSHSIQISGMVLGGYETLFVGCAIAIATSSIAFSFLREEGAAGVRDFLSQFYSGNSLRVLWGIHRYANQTSEERRRDLTYRFGGARSVLAKEELFQALHDPSFDVRYEAIGALGHLPLSQSVVEALEAMARYDGLVELQYAALASLGRIKAKSSHQTIASFLVSQNPLLRARAARSLGDIADASYLPQIRILHQNDPEVDCRLAAVSALGKLKDHESLDALLGFYCELAITDNNIADEPRSKVILLALSKILNCEGSFSLEWRREEKFIGYRLPNLVNQVASALRRLSVETDQHRQLLMQVSRDLATGSTISAFQALQSLCPYIANSTHEDAGVVLKMLDATKTIQTPHRALLILLCLIMRPVLRK